MTQAVIDLDANATTRPLPEVVEVVARHLRDTAGNPGSRHALGRRARRVLEDSREAIAAVLGADPEEVVFTSGGTEANNLAVFGLARGGGPQRTILLTPGEHPSVLEACRVLQARGWSLAYFPLDDQGRIADFPRHAGPLDQVRLAAVILAHNETGVIQDVAPLADACRERNIPLHLDAVQAVGKIPVNFHALGAATLSFGAHKFHGPRGIGGLLIRRGTVLAPLLVGGHQEQARRAGTEAVPLIAGMAAALELWARQQAQRTAHLTALRDRLQAQLLDRCAPAVIQGERAPRLPNTLNIAFPGVDGEALLVALDLEGICCSLGSTCASGSMEPAPVLIAMGCPPEISRASVRFSLSIENSVEHIDFAVERIAAAVARLRNAGGMAR
uniref:Cysteine desulfurase n=1 Tax=Schlesneria paludicola TaxID=360056 RepID=A0A7C4LKC5_9PLAN